MLVACSSRPSAVPEAYAEVADSVAIYPDYRGVTVPPNIAPLNFCVADASATEFVAVMMPDTNPAGGATATAIVCGATADGKFDIDTTAWRQLTASTRGGSIAVTVYAHRRQGWVRHPAFGISVAADSIDQYLSYRLIEPGYELYRQLGIYQRNVGNFDETPIYENNRSYDDDENHCVNCHSYQGNDSQRTLFHVRAAHGGTIITHGSEAHKVAIRHDSILAAGVYPAWHPTLPLVAFSTNKTGQVFHMLHSEKIEVLDEASDLILYDAEANTVCNILRTAHTLETFPAWSPDGRRLYYCAAEMPTSLHAEHTPMDVALRYDSLLYNIWSMPFDPATRRFGEPRLEVDAAAIGRSASVPRISPDGHYMLFTMARYGQFHIWHKSADLWLKELGDDAPAHPLTPVNSPDADSYHTWSANGRWMAFASRRDDGGFTRIYIAHFATNGRADKPFLLPQRDPEYNTLLLKSHNVPELSRSAVQTTPAQLKHTVLHTEPQPATYHHTPIQ